MGDYVKTHGAWQNKNASSRPTPRMRQLSPLLCAFLLDLDLDLDLGLDLGLENWRSALVKEDAGVGHVRRFQHQRVRFVNSAADIATNCQFTKTRFLKRRCFDDRAAGRNFTGFAQPLFRRNKVAGGDSNEVRVELCIAACTKP
jgi:hypothetical protein